MKNLYPGFIREFDLKTAFGIFLVETKTSEVLKKNSDEDRKHKI